MEEARALSSAGFPEMIPQQAMEILDTARTYNGGNPPATIRSADGSVEIPNFWKRRPPQTILGAESLVP
jgi:alkaline phosphatase D